MWRKPYWLLGLTLAMAVVPPLSRADGPAVVATHVWIHAPQPGASVMQGYMTLKNLSNEPLTLAGISSPDFASITIQQAPDIPAKEQGAAPHTVISAHGEFVFAPGGHALLLSQPVKKLYEGDLVTLMLTFSDHSSLTIIAPVRMETPPS